MTEVLMPRLSDSMEEATILQWLKDDGAQVRRGEELVEIETDKATVVYESELTGTLTIIAGEGDTIALGQPIAAIGEPAADGGSGGAPAAAGAAPATAAPVPAAAAPADASAEPAPASAERGPGCSPVARRMAQRLGVSLDDVTGSGPRGRILKADVRAAAQAPSPSDARADGHAAPAAAPAPAPAPAPAAAAAPAGGSERDSAKGVLTTESLSRVQETIARRMAESKATAPDFMLTVDVDMERCVALRAELKQQADSGDVVPSYNDMVIRACALALREFPRANGSYRDGGFELHSRINVGMAVAASDALIVPVIADADRRTLGDIARESRRLAQRTRDGAVTPAELAGGTFTVSNLGMFGISSFNAVLNPPQAAILAVGKLERRPVVRDDEVVPRSIMTMTLTCDHRILYGADAAQFLGRVRDLLERPLRMAL